MGWRRGQMLCNPSLQNYYLASKSIGWSSFQNYYPHDTAPLQQLCVALARPTPSRPRKSDTTCENYKGLEVLVLRRKEHMYKQPEMPTLYEMKGNYQVVVIWGVCDILGAVG